MRTAWLTIIIPTFNAEATLAKCLSSLKSQTFQDFKVLILDGFSEDATVSIAHEFDSLLNDLKVYVESDSGIYDAMNKGIDRCDTEWLYFLGSDDFLADKYVLENVWQQLNTAPYCDVIYGQVISSRQIHSSKIFPTARTIVRHNICHQSIFLKKKIFERTGYFDLRYKGLADWDHNMKWFLDPEIRKLAIDLNIAVYADGGFSSVNLDQAFAAERRINYLKYGSVSLPVWRKLQVFLMDVLGDLFHLKFSHLKKVLQTAKFVFR